MSTIAVIKTIMKKSTPTLCVILETVAYAYKWAYGRQHEKNDKKNAQLHPLIPMFTVKLRAACHTIDKIANLLTSTNELHGAM